MLALLEEKWGGRNVTSLQRLIGMPVVGGKNPGLCGAGVLSKSGKQLQGLVIRRGWAAPVGAAAPSR